MSKVFDSSKVKGKVCPECLSRIFYDWSSRSVKCSECNKIVSVKELLEADYCQPPSDEEPNQPTPTPTPPK